MPNQAQLQKAAADRRSGRKIIVLWHTPVAVVALLAAVVHAYGFSATVAVVGLFSLVMMTWAVRSNVRSDQWLATNRPNATATIGMSFKRDQAATLGLDPTHARRITNVTLVADDDGVELLTARTFEPVARLPWSRITGASAWVEPSGTSNMQVLELRFGAQIARFTSYGMAPLARTIIEARPESDPWPAS